MTGTDLLQRFADLVVRVGVNVQPDQGVVVRADTAHLETARAVVQQAYAAGAGWVDVDWTDGPIRRSRLLHATPAELTRTRPWTLERIRSWTAEGVCFITLAGEADPHLLDDVDPAKVAARPVEELRAMQQAMIEEQLRWTVVAAPNPGWARQVFGEPDTDRLWAAVATAMRLDEPDPVTRWRDRHAELAARARALDALELTEVRYHGSGTDLTVGLLPETRWTGGGEEDPSGLFYLPNIPTEEVFTSPDRRRADGRIRLTRPVVIGGRLVEGLVVTFAGGRITEATAVRGADVVRAQLDTDEGARSLGEVALVDRDSRIAKAGVVFHNTLFDENAGCHVAWGFSFPFAVAGGLAKSDDERYELGLNRSTVHTDVVIGGEGLTVTGTGPSGSVDLLRDDEWVLPV
ncbi:aminopeptidase [Plantactinospora sp. KBS50]|uniref:aminopeptidase n=1 Tax=Plantactinospora sp. KBS50 TaxID=2024580 RepID=UPI000BAAE976|nr:aminopeptidase [Plantactinospora sp. KBS50]ASW53458.1 aminopeptidase [Plantactinospora sp. KBS50]